MQGVIFVAIHQHLRDLGDEELRRQCFPEPSAYLAFRDYPEAELLAIAKTIAERVPALAQPVTEVLRSLGEEVAAVVKRTAPALLPKASTLQELLEVLEKKDDDSRMLLPRMRVLKDADARVSLEHVGDPSVCRFDEGLLIGLAAIAGERVVTRHPTCRQRKDDACIFVPRVLAGDVSRGRLSMTLRFSADADTDTDKETP